MLALPIALLLALPAGDAVATEGRAPQDPSVPPQTLIPYGSAHGSWVAGTLYDDGILVALLEDAAGRPVFVMDARLTPSGHVEGVLRPLEYATNPVLGLPPLYVDGQAKISAEGDGTFEAMIATPLDGAIPVHPFGRIEGVLLPGMRRAKPGQHPSGALSDGAVATAERKRIRGLLQHPGSGNELAVLADATAAGSFDEIDPQDGAAVIVCPYGGSASLAHSVPVGVGLSAAAAQGQVDPEVVTAAELVQASAAGAQTAIGAGAVSYRFGRKDAGSHGEIEPTDAQASTLQLAGAAALGATAETGSQSSRVRFTDAGARRAAEAGEAPSSNVEQGAAGAHRETEPGVPPSGEGRVRARWYLLP